MTGFRSFRLTVALAGAAALAACSGGGSTEADGNSAAVVNDTLIPIDGNIAEVPPSETPVNVTEPDPVVEPTAVPSPAAGFDSSRVDIQDGADAVGMTSRVDRTKGAATTNGGNETAPAQ